MKGRHIARHRLQPKRAQRAEAQSGSCRPKRPPSPANGGRVALPPDAGHHQFLAQSHSSLPPVWGPLPTRQEAHQFERKTKAHLFLLPPGSILGFATKKKRKRKKSWTVFQMFWVLANPKMPFAKMLFPLIFKPRVYFQNNPIHLLLIHLHLTH